VQPGNSGGPLLDLSGNVVGIIVGKLDAIKVAQATGDIPQNVNFAISALSARAFLDSQAVPYETASSEVQHSAADVAAMARQYTVRIECWN
jgi:S1-C subfamily serine protease